MGAGCLLCSGVVGLLCSYPPLPVFFGGRVGLVRATMGVEGVVRVPGHAHGNSIKVPHVYEALKRKGMSKTQAAKISNAMAGKGRGKGRGRGRR